MAASSIGNKIDAIRYVFSGDALSDAQRIGAAARTAAQRADASAQAEQASATFTPSTASTELDTRDQQAVEALRRIDQRVHQHEQAHISVGGDLILSGPNYAYETGPDGKRYAVAGEVTIDTSPARTPEDTVPKAQHIRATALAPSDPSPQDHSVAAIASGMEAKAQQQIAMQALEARAAARSEANLYQKVAQYDGGSDLPAASVNDFA